MKMNKIAEAVVLWLPGFEPETWSGPKAAPEAAQAAVVDPSPMAVLPEGVITQRKDSVGFVRRVEAAKPPKEVWPYLAADQFGGGVGEVARFDANMAAIAAVKAVDAADAPATPEQRAALARYTGWGALPRLFGYQYESSWKERADRLRAALTEGEWKAAEASTPNAHYTSHEVITAMWQAVERLGFRGGKVLEPSAGAGNFLGAMPTKLAQASQVTAVELDTVSARITKALYGQYGVKVVNDGFEKHNPPEGFYDLVISNVPFGNYEVADLKHPELSRFSIHDYFIAKALKLTRVGGLVAVITSSYTLDKMSDAARVTIAGMADLVGAVRLPRSAFKAVAGTSVVTDILFFQRRAEGAETDRGWTASPKALPEGVRAELGSFAYLGQANPWYIAKPEMVIGKFDTASNGRAVCLSVSFEGDLVEALSERVAMLPEGIMTQRVQDTTEVSPRQMLMASAGFVKPGAYVVQGGKLAVSVDGSRVEVIEGAITEAKARRIRAMIPVRDAARKVLAAQVSSDDDTLLERYRISLLASYEAFVSEFGPISKRFNQSALREDPDFPLLLSLEHWDEDAQVAKKADLFYRRTVGAYRRVQRCETPEEALQVCLAESARVVPVRIAELLEMEVNAAMDMLRTKGLVFVDPLTENYVDAGEYLSGDVKTKLSIAEHADGFAENVEALTEVLPEDIPAHEIGVKLGSAWVPAATYTAFVRELLQSADMRVSKNPAANSWEVSGHGNRIAAHQTYGTSRVGAGPLIELALNQQVPRVTDPDPNDPEGKKRVVNTKETVAAAEKLDAIKAKFAEWVWADNNRADLLVNLYNTRFNRTVNRKYDGGHLQLPGFSNAYTLRKHQLDGIWRSVSGSSSTLLAHVVGAGKTLTMICSAMEMRRTGRASKPVIVVPNHMLEQVAAEFLRAYPAANVLIASKEDMEPARRKTLLARMATGDWDAVVLTHSSFERVPMPKGYSEAVIADNVALLEAQWREARNNRDGRAVKELAKLKKTWAARLEKRAEGSGKDDLLDFAEIGFDALFVDEFHYFKNLYKHTNLKLPGVGSSDSNRAFDMSVKVGYVQSIKDGRNVVAATGTPIANSVSEMWVMQKFLQPRVLASNGHAMFDAWAADFGEAVTGMELAPDGSSYRVHTRFAKFVNVPELMTVFREVADIKTADMLDLPVPVAKREIITAEPSEELKDYVKSLVARAEAIRNRQVTPQEDNMLAITGDGRKAATDVRMVGGRDYEGSKISLVAENVHQIWRASAAERGTQMVFLDMGTPTGRSFNVYEDIRIKLEKLGVPRSDVAFIHEAGTDKAKEKLFQSVRDGVVRVMIGSTQKMGTGVNVQKRLVALHHVDGPWRPADVEQRDGRIVRQGNENASVRILRYVTAGTFDAYVWQTLETKARFIAQVMQGDTSIRSMEDAEMAALSYAEVKALASGNPLVIEKAGVDAEVMRLSMLKSVWQGQVQKNRQTLALLPGWIKRDEALLAELKVDAENAAKAAKSMVFKIKGKVVDAEDLARSVLGSAFMAKGREVVTVGTVGDFEINVMGAASLLSEPQLFLSGRCEHEVGRINKTAGGIVGQIRRTLETYILEDVVRVSGRLQDKRRELEGLRQLGEGQFEHEATLTRILVRKAELDALLCPTTEETADVVDVGDEPAALAA